MRHESIDELLKASAPITDDALSEIPLDRLADEMRKAVMSTPLLDSIAPPEPAAPRRPWVRRGVIAAAVAAVLITGFVVYSPRTNGSSAWAAEVLAVAEASPRLLVSLDGWEVVRADEFTPDLGEMTFSNGTASLDLHWRPGSDHDDYVADRAAGSEPPTATAVNGKPAVQFQYVDTTHFTTLWREGDLTLEARGVFPDESEYAAVVAALMPVDVETWLRAMPESVVRPDSRAAVVAEMLEDVPQPAGLDVASLATAASISDRYQLGARVSGAVACAWIEQWLDARASGDAAAETEALDAMRTARNWPILLEMADSGAYPQVLWMHVDAMEAGGNDPNGLGIGGYVDALGCDPSN